jgi:carboxyl-terminal processing protease
MIILPLVLSMIVIISMFLGIKVENSGHVPDKMDAVFQQIEENYIEAIDRDELIELALPEVLQKLDPHSIYIPAEQYKEMNETLQGNFEGIGVQFNLRKDTIVVVQVIENGPAQAAGVLAGDRIVTINDSLFAGKGISTDEVMKNLKGPGGTTVTIGVKRGGEKDLVPISIRRGQIPLESVDVAYMIDDNIGYIKISNFGMHTYAEFWEALFYLKSMGMNKMILDLRGNGGGLLNQAVSIVDEFLQENELIVYTKGRKRERVDYSATGRGICTQDDLIVLIDELTASASEIIAGAIQDNCRGKVFGRRSFGKGLVQEKIAFKDGSEMRLTIARYYTPTGRCIQKSYDDGAEDYYSEISDRLINGEFLEQDSTKLQDSLKYVTSCGEVVYGGGGIWPDKFIPFDTTGNSTGFTKLVDARDIYDYAFEYVDSKRKVLNQVSTLEELEAYLDSVKIEKIYFDRVIKKKLITGMDEVANSKDIILTQLKAYIARNVLDDEGYYPIIGRIDNALQEAIKELSKSN